MTIFHHAKYSLNILLCLQVFLHVQATTLNIEWNYNSTGCGVSEVDGTLLNENTIEVRWNCPDPQYCENNFQVNIYYTQCTHDFAMLEDSEMYSRIPSYSCDMQQSFRKNLDREERRVYYCTVGLKISDKLLVALPTEIQTNDGLSTAAIVIIVFGVVAAVGGIIGAVIAYKKVRPRQWEAFEQTVRNSIRRMSIRRNGHRTLSPTIPIAATSASAEHPTATLPPPRAHRNQPIQMQQVNHQNAESNTGQQPHLPPRRQQFHHQLQEVNKSNSRGMVRSAYNSGPVPPDYSEAVSSPYQNVVKGHQNPPTKPLPQTYGQNNEGFELDV